MLTTTDNASCHDVLATPCAQEPYHGSYLALTIYIHMPSPLETVSYLLYTLSHFALLSYSIELQYQRRRFVPKLP